MTLAVCSVNGYTLPTSGSTGFNASAGETITVALTAAGGQFQINCTSADGFNPLSTVALVQATKLQDFENNTCVFTVPDGYFSALQFTATINDDPGTAFVFGVFVEYDGLRGFFPGEVLESNITSGISYDLNALLEKTGAAFTPFTPGGDLSGTSTVQTVIGIQGNPVKAVTLGASQDGYVATYVYADGLIEFKPAAGGTSFTAGGDLSGSNTSQTVIGIENKPIVLTSLSTNQLLVYNGTDWVNQLLVNANISNTAAIAYSKLNLTGDIVNSDISSSAAVSVNKLAHGTDAQALLTNGSNIPTWTSISGDLSLTDIGTTTVVALQNNSVNSLALGATQDGYVLTWKNSGGQWTAEPITSGSVTLMGDVTGPATSNTVTALQGHSVSSTAPTNGYVLEYNSGTSKWTPTALPTAFSAGGDLSGTATSQTVVGIHGFPVVATAPLTGQVLEYNGTNYVPTTPSGGFTAGGDLSGSSTVQTVIAIQGVSVSTASPTSGQILEYNSGTSKWTPTATSGIFTAGGDLSGTATSQNVIKIQGNPVTSGGVTEGQFLVGTGTNTWAPTSITGDITSSVSTPGKLTVSKIDGASVPAAGSLTTGNVLQVTGASALSYAAVNLAGGSNYVTGSLPSGNQASQTMGGDVSGTTASATVNKISGNTSGHVPITSPIEIGTNPATTSEIGIPNNTGLYGRNAANNGDIQLVASDTSNNINIGGDNYANIINIGAGAFVEEIVIGNSAASPTIQLGNGAGSVVIPNLSGYNYAMVVATSSGQLSVTGNVLYDFPDNILNVGGTALQLNATLQWVASPTTPALITQVAMAATNTPTAGATLQITPQAGSNAISGNTNGGAGGTLYVLGATGGVKQGSGTNGAGGGITVSTGQAGGVGANPGSLNIQAGTVNTLSLCASGIELYAGGPLGLTTGTQVLGAANYRYPHIELNGSMSGNNTVQFPANDGSTWIVNTNQVTYNGHTITFQANSHNWSTTSSAGGVYLMYYDGQSAKLWGVALTS